jgi:lipopolysaccharide heptosyltransferase II
MTWHTAANVLCVRLDQIGDVLMTTPAIRAVKESRPGRRVTLLTSPAGAEVAALVPEIDDAIAYASPWMKASGPQGDGAADRAMIERLRARRFDAAIIFTVYSQSPLPAALLLHLAGIPLRLAHCRENPYALLSDWVKETEPEGGVRHEVRRQLDLVASVGYETVNQRLSARVSHADRMRVRGLLAAGDAGADRPRVVVHPGASAPSRRYPPALFAEVCRRLALDGCRVIFTGSAEEQGLVAGIQRAMAAPSYSLVGQLSLGELAALVELAPVLVANNTGPVHLAAAVGTPVVDLYALTNPQHTPWGVPSRVLSADVPCKYCYKSVCPEGHGNCLALVPPEAVVRATHELMAETASRARPMEVSA